LAAIGEEDDDDEGDFWLCETAQAVNSDMQMFNVHWLEVTDDETGEKRLTYEKSKEKNSLEMDYVLMQVELRENKANGVYTLSQTSKKAILKTMKEVKAGKDPDFKKKALDDLVNGDNEEEEEEQEEERPPKKKAKVISTPKKTTLVKRKTKEESKHRKRARSTSDVEVQPARKKTKAKAPAKKASKKAKEPPPKRHPNWRLKPNETIKVLDKDPLFETNEKVPFVSSVAQSKLAIRAILTK